MKRKKDNVTSDISAIDLLKQEAERLTVMASRSKGSNPDRLKTLAWAFDISSAYLASLDAKERIHRFKELSPAAVKMERAKEDELVEARITKHRLAYEKHGLD